MFKHIPPGLLRTGVLGILLAIVLALVGGAIFFSLPRGEDVLRRQLESILSRTLAQNVRIQRLETNLLSRLQLFQARVEPPDSTAAPLLLSIDHVRLGFRVWHLFSKPLHLRSLDVDGFRVVFNRDTSGVFELPLLSRGPAADTTRTSGTLGIRIDHLTARNTSLAYSDMTLPLQGSVQGLQFDLAMHEGIIPFRLATEVAALTTSSYPFQFTGLTLEGQWQGALLEINPIACRVQDFTVQGGLALDFDTPGTGLTGRLNLTGPFQSAIDFFQWGVPQPFAPIDGLVELECELVGTLADYAFPFTARFPYLGAAGVNLRNGVAHGIYQADTLKVHELAVRINEGNALASGWVIPSGNYPYLVSLHARNLELNGLWQPVFQYFQWPMPDRLQPVRGTVHLDGTWSGSYDEMAIRFNAELPTIQAADLLIHDNSVEGLFRSDTLTLFRTLLGTGAGNIRGSGWLVAADPYPHQIYLQAENLQPEYFWPAVMDYFQWQLPERMSPLTGRMDLEAELFGSIPDPGIILAARIPSLRLPEFSLHQSSIVGAFHADTLRLHELALNTGKGTVRGSGWLIPAGPVPHQVSLHLADLNLEHLWELAYGPSSPFTGRLAAVIESRGSFADLLELNTHGQLELTGLTYQDRPLPDLDFLGHLEQGITPVSLRQGETRASLTARAFEETLQGEFTAQLAAVEHLLQLFDIAGIEGSVQLAGKIGGNRHDPSLDGNFTADGLRVYQLPLDSCRASFSFSRGKLGFQHGIVASHMARLENLDQPLHFEGLRGTIAFQLQFSGRLDDPHAKLFVNLGQPGYRDLNLDQSLVALQLDQRQITIDTLALRKDSLLLVSQGTLALDDSTGSLYTTAYLIIPTELGLILQQPFIAAAQRLGDILTVMKRDSQRQWWINLRSTGLDLAGLSNALGTGFPVMGDLRFLFDIGPIPTDPALSLDWQIRAPGYATFSADSLRGRATIKPALFTLDSLEMFAGTGPPRLAASGALPLDPVRQFTIKRNDPLSGRLNVDHLDLQWLKPLLDTDQDLQGLLSCRLSLTGTPRKPKLRGALEWQDGTLQMGAGVQPVRSLVAAAHLENSLLSIQHLSGEIQGLPFLLTGSIQLAQLPAVRLNLQLDVAQITAAAVNGYLSADSSDLNLSTENLNLALVHPFLPGFHTLNGILSSRLSLNGATRRPHLKGDMHLTDGRIQLSPESLPLEALVAYVTLADSILTIHEITAAVQGIPLLLSGKIYTHRWLSYRSHMKLLANNQEVLSVQGILAPDTLAMNLLLEEMNLALVQPFVRNVSNLTGRSSATLNLFGKPNDPSFRGSLAIWDGSFRIQPGDLDISQGHLALAFESKHVRIDSMQAVISENGTVKARGTLDILQGQPTNLDITILARDIKYAQPRMYSLNLRSVQMTLIERDRTYFVDGDIVLGDSRYRKPLQVKNILAFFSTIDRPRPELPDPLRRTRLNLRVKDSQQLWVDNNLVRIRFRTDLVLMGPLTDPVLAGRITAQEGYAYYLDRRFTIKEGVLNFVDPARINPEVTLVAESRIKSYQTPAPTTYTITLAVNGPIDQANVELLSNPPLDRIDIIAMLTVGATRDQLLGRSMTGTLQDRLTGLSSEKISRYTSQKLAEFLDLDNVSIEGDLFRFNRSWGPQLVASRKLSDRMDITYHTTIGQLNDQGIRLDYTLSKNFLLAGSTNNRGQSGLDLKFRIQFR